jgi:hypothetical protein
VELRPGQIDAQDVGIAMGGTTSSSGRRIGRHSRPRLRDRRPKAMNPASRPPDLVRGRAGSPAKKCTDGGVWDRRAASTR